MIATNLFKVCLISLFVELAVCSCREGGRWCLTNGQCCSHACSWTFKCKPKKVECIHQNDMCSGDEDCCSMNCINKGAGQGVCGEAETIGPEDSDFIKESNEKGNNIEDEYGLQVQKEDTIENENGLELRAEYGNSEFEEHFGYAQPVSAAEDEITEKPMSLPNNPLLITITPMPHPANSHITIKPMPHPADSHITTKPKSSLDNSINIDTSSFEHFLNTLHNISVSESLED